MRRTARRTRSRSRSRPSPRSRRLPGPWLWERPAERAARIHDLPPGPGLHARAEAGAALLLVGVADVQAHAGAPSVSPRLVRANGTGSDDRLRTPLVVKRGAGSGRPGLPTIGA